MTNIDEIIKQSKIVGNILTLPEIQLDRKTYLDVAKKLEFIGGKWTRKVGGFVFQTNPKELLPEIFGKRNIKKELQFFETPYELADYLLTLVPKNPTLVLEPSAGRGALVRAINRAFPKAKVHYCEYSSINKKMFEGDAAFITEDFLAYHPIAKYDAIIANPPFARNQDITHFYKMFDLCAQGGFILSIMSNHWRICKNKKETQFRDFLKQHNAKIFNIESGAFKESGTMISSCIVCLIKEKV